MDPAFSLADELAGIEDDFTHHYPDEHTATGGLGDLASELALSQDSQYEVRHTRDYTGSLADELDLVEAPDMSRTASQLSDQYATSSAFDTGMESVSPGRSGAASPSMTLLPAANLIENFASTDVFLRKLNTLTDQSSDTAALESIAGDLLKLVSQSTLEREAQIRELREMEREASRLTTDTHSFTLSSSSNYLVEANTDTLSDLGEDEEGADYDTSRDTISKSPQRRRMPLTKRHSTISLASSTDTNITLSHAQPDTLEANALFNDLQTSTISLTSALTNLHEHSQVTKSTIANAARKLKSVRTILTQYRQEDDLVERSQDWITTHGSRPLCEDARPISIWTANQLESCKRQLQDVDLRVRTLLTPVSLLA